MLPQMARPTDCPDNERVNRTWSVFLDEDRCVQRHPTGILRALRPVCRSLSVLYPDGRPRTDSPFTSSTCSSVTIAVRRPRCRWLHRPIDPDITESRPRGHPASGVRILYRMRTLRPVLSDGDRYIAAMVQSPAKDCTRRSDTGRFAPSSRNRVAAGRYSVSDPTSCDRPLKSCARKGTRCRSTRPKQTSWSRHRRSTCCCCSRMRWRPR